MAPATHSPDVLIAGAGIIGLTLALELRNCGAAVTILDHVGAMRAASVAAAGMLAAEDPHNSPSLLALARFSLSLYPKFLARIEQLSGEAVPFQTDTTIQYLPQERTQMLAERSIDPRQLGSALRAATRAASIGLVEHASIDSLQTTATGVQVQTASGDTIHAGQFVHATGSWALPGQMGRGIAVFPCKGQMLRVTMPPNRPLREVHRAEHVYVVPRSEGPQAGTALIGATVEDAGFDVTTSAAQLQQLREQAATLGPATAFAADAPLVEAWAGLRPSTPDGLPLIGLLREHQWIATGHFRNGILLAPATACVLAELLAGNRSSVDLAAFTPARFSHSPSSATGSDIRPCRRDNA